MEVLRCHSLLNQWVITYGGVGSLRWCSETSEAVNCGTKGGERKPSPNVSNHRVKCRESSFIEWRFGALTLRATGKAFMLPELLFFYCFKAAERWQKLLVQISAMAKGKGGIRNIRSPRWRFSNHCIQKIAKIQTLQQTALVFS